MGNLLGEPFNRYVSDQIYVRQEVHGKKTNRTSSDIAYLNSRNAWVKLASGAFLEEKRLKLESKLAYKGRFGQSPDLADAAFLCVALARQRHGLIAVDPPKGKTTGHFQKRKSLKGLSQILTAETLID